MTDVTGRKRTADVTGRKGTADVTQIPSFQGNVLGGCGRLKPWLDTKSIACVAKVWVPRLRLLTADHGERRQH